MAKKVAEKSSEITADLEKALRSSYRYNIVFNRNKINGEHRGFVVNLPNSTYSFPNDFDVSWGLHLQTVAGSCRLADISLEQRRLYIRSKLHCNFEYVGFSVLGRIVLPFIEFPDQLDWIIEEA